MVTLDVEVQDGGNSALATDTTTDYCEYSFDEASSTDEEFVFDRPTTAKNTPPNQKKKTTSGESLPPKAKRQKKAR